SRRLYFANSVLAGCKVSELVVTHLAIDAAGDGGNAGGDAILIEQFDDNAADPLLAGGVEMAVVRAVVIDPARKTRPDMLAEVVANRVDSGTEMNVGEQAVESGDITGEAAG